MKTGVKNLFHGASLFILLALAPGCSLMNPHVTCQEPWVLGEGKCPLAKSREGDIKLGTAIQYADYFKTSYESALGDQAKLVSLTGVTLIPLAASAIGLGLTSGHDNTITMLGLMGATGYGTSRWLQSQPRQLVYIKGITAMNCAVDAVLPLDLIDVQKSLLRTGLEALGGAIQKVETKLIEEKQQKGKDLSAIENRYAAAKEVWGKGIKLEFEIHQVGRVLVSAVDRINTEVDKALVATEPNFDDLTKIITSLAQTTASFTAVSTSTAEKKLPGGGDGVRTNSTSDRSLLTSSQPPPTLEQLADEMDVAKWQVEKILAVVREAAQTKNLTNCGVRPETPPAAGIVVKPATLTSKKGTAVTSVLHVSGGKGDTPRYSARLIGDGITGISVDQPEPFGATVLVRVTSQAPVGDYQIYITDGGQTGQIVDLKITP